MTPENSLWRKILSVALFAIGGLFGLALAGWLFFATWGAISDLQYAWRPTVWFLAGLVLPLAGGFFVFWLAWAVGQRVRGPARPTTGLDQDLPLLAQLGVASGLLAGVIVAAYDSYLASYGLGRSSNFAAFFLTGVFPVIVGLLAAAPLVAVSLMFSHELGVWERRTTRTASSSFTWRAMLRATAFFVGAGVAIGVFVAAIKLGWGYFFRDRVLQGEWPRAFWVVLLAYGATLVGGAFYYPFFAFAKSLRENPVN